MVPRTFANPAINGHGLGKPSSVTGTSIRAGSSGSVIRRSSEASVGWSGGRPRVGLPRWRLAIGSSFALGELAFEGGAVRKDHERAAGWFKLAAAGGHAGAETRLGQMAAEGLGGPKDLAAAIADAREALDHRLLNEVEGLRAPTLELVALWLWNRLSNRVPGLAEIHVARDTCHEGVVYRGPQNPSRMAAE